MTLRAVLFDWDGTLVDTCEPVYRAYARVFADYGIGFDRETYASTYSPAWQHTYRCVQLSEDRWPDADRKWLEYFEQEPVAGMVDGVADALKTLSTRGIACGIVTSGTRSRVVRELAAHGVDHHFAAIVCGDDGPRRKPDPDALLVCLGQLGVAPEDAAYIGDSAEDVMMAHAAGVVCVGVCGTYPNHDTLIAASPDYVASSLSEAVNHVVNGLRRPQRGSSEGG
ncbi:MAG: HAD-IA family hydrolase [Thermoanaerobaculia bacterium]